MVSFDLNKYYKFRKIAVKDRKGHQKYTTETDSKYFYGFDHKCILVSDYISILIDSISYQKNR